LVSSDEMPRQMIHTCTPRYHLMRCLVKYYIHIPLCII